MGRYVLDSHFFTEWLLLLLQQLPCCYQKSIYTGNGMVELQGYEDFTLNEKLKWVRAREVILESALLFYNDDPTTLIIHSCTTNHEWFVSCAEGVHP